MTDKNLLMQDDAFAPAVPDTMEHLPSFHAEQPDRRILQAEGKHPAPCARFCESNAYEIEIRRLNMKLAGDSKNAERYRLAVSSEDNASELYAAVVCNWPDIEIINAVFDEAITKDAA